MLFRPACLAALLFIAPAFAVTVGDKPTIDWKTVDGRAVTNAQLRGRIIVIDFWATWCGPCMAQADHMVHLKKQYADKNVNILGVSLDTDVAKMKQVAKEKGFDWPQVCEGHGWEGTINRSWGVDSIPHTFILSPEGTIIWAGHPAEIDAPLEQAVSQFKAPPDPRVEAIHSIEAAAQKLFDKDYAAVASTLAKLPDGAWQDDEVRAALKTLMSKAPKGGEEGDKFGKALANEEGLPAKIVKLAAGPRSGGAATRPAEGADHGALARAQFTKAEKAREGGNDVLAYELYHRLSKSFRGTPEAAAAADQVAKYEKDPAVMAAVKRDEAEHAARASLAMARSYRDAGKSDLARQTYESIIKDDADATATKEARAELAELK